MEMQIFGKEEYDRLMKPILTVGKFTAMWPPNKDSGTRTVMFKYCHTAFMFLLAMSSSIAVTADAIHNSDDLNEATECALICTAFYLSALRIVIYFIHQDDMRYVLETMKSDWVFATNEDILVLREKCNFTFQLAKYFIFTVGFTIISFIFISIIEVFILQSEARTFSFRGYYFANQTNSPIFELLYMFNASTGIFCSCTIAGATSFNLTAVMHGSAKFAILQKKLETLRRDDRNSNSAIVACVRRHQDAITFADSLERIINILALGQFVISTGLLCFAGFQITSMMEDRGRLMKYLTFLNSAILELFLFSFSGQSLIDESEAVGLAAYESDWTGSSFTRQLQVITMRSRNSSKVTAAKFYAMSLESFSTVLSTSFSYFTVLQAMNGE